MLTKAGGRRQEAGGCFWNGDLCPAPKTFRLKRRGFRPDFFDNLKSSDHNSSSKYHKALRSLLKFYQQDLYETYQVTKYH
jgi:hypothetical protein